MTKNKTDNNITIDSTDNERTDKKAEEEKEISENTKTKSQNKGGDTI